MPRCRDAGLARATLSRGFAAAYGVTPARYRADVRLVGPEPLVQLALALGYADQAHFSRAVRATGMTPRQLRQSNPFKTPHAAPPLACDRP